MNSYFMILMLSLLINEPDLELRRNEAHLIGRNIPSSLLATNLLIRENGNWRTLRLADVKKQNAPILIMHLWAPHCKPCVAELSSLREVARRIESFTKRKAQFIFISESSNAEMTWNYYDNYMEVFPNRALFIDPNEILGEYVRRVLPKGNLPLPITLILDDKRIIRHALIGANLQRHGELISAIHVILKAIK